MALLNSAVQITPKASPLTIYLSSLLSFGVPAGMKSNGGIAISGLNNPKNATYNDISVVFLTFWCDGMRRGDPLSAVRAADVKSFDIIEISGPNNPKIDAHNDISVVFLRF